MTLMKIPSRDRRLWAKFVTGIVAIGAVTTLGVFYFFLVKQDGIVFATIAALIAGLAGFHLGRRRKP